VFVVLGIEHAMRMRQIVTVACPAVQISPLYLTNGTIFAKTLLNKNVCFDFLNNFV
jgi:hypothetical protein